MPHNHWICSIKRNVWAYLVGKMLVLQYSTISHNVVLLTLEHYNKQFTKVCMIVTLSSTIIFNVFLVVTMKIMFFRVGCYVVGRWVLAFDSISLLPSSSSSQMMGAASSSQILIHNYHHIIGEDYFHAC